MSCFSASSIPFESHVFWKRELLSDACNCLLMYFAQWQACKNKFVPEVIVLLEKCVSLTHAETETALITSTIGVALMACFAPDVLCPSRPLGTAVRWEVTSWPFAFVCEAAHLASSDAVTISFWTPWPTHKGFQTRVDTCGSLHASNFTLMLKFAQWESTRKTFCLSVLPDQLSKTTIQLPKEMDFCFYCFLCLPLQCPIRDWILREEKPVQARLQGYSLTMMKYGSPPWPICVGTASYWVRLEGVSGEWELR